MKLIIANKLYSSWSLRPWMLMTALEIPFEEEVIPLYQSDTAARIAKHTPAGRVPVLIDGGMSVWESLAIVEYLHEKFPDRKVWPRTLGARVHARSIANEMHAGFGALRQACPMNLGKRMQPKLQSADVMANVERIAAIWKEARRRFGGDGSFLFGDFTAADAMYAPVVTRLDTYQIPVAAETRTYMDAILGHPAFTAWRTAALQEPWTIAHYEEGYEAAEVYHRPKA
jgi:glutathione S-transferase